MLQRFMPVSALALAFLLLGCEDVPTAETTGAAGDQIWLATGQGGGKPGGTPASPAISFASGGPYHRNLKVMDADGGNVTEIYSGAYMMHSSWSDQGDGKPGDPYVILVSMTCCAQPLEKLSVVVEAGVPVVQDIHQLSSETRYLDAAVRPGGSCFAAVDLENLGGGAFRNSLVLGDMETGEMQVLYQADVDVALNHPDWNADGTKVAFVERWVDDPNHNVDLQVIDIGSIDLGTCQATTPSTATAFSFSFVGNPPSNLSWARTSNELLLDVDHQLYRVDLDAPEPALGIPFEEGYTAVWSPDDTQMAYRRDGRFYIKTFATDQDQLIRKADHVPDWRRLAEDVENGLER